MPAEHFVLPKRIRLDEGSYYPDYMDGTGLDEIWMGCTVPIVTGVIDTRTARHRIVRVNPMFSLRVVR